MYALFINLSDLHFYQYFLKRLIRYKLLLINSRHSPIRLVFNVKVTWIYYYLDWLFAIAAATAPLVKGVSGSDKAGSSSSALNH